MSGFKLLVDIDCSAKIRSLVIRVPLIYIVRDIDLAVRAFGQMCTAHTQPHTHTHRHTFTHTHTHTLTHTHTHTHIHSCLWFFLEPVVHKSENYGFLHKLLESIKQTTDGQSTGSAEANKVRTLASSSSIRLQLL